MKSPSRLVIFAILVLLPPFFVSNLIIGRASVGVVEPYTLAFWRWLVASLIVLPFAWAGLAANAARFRAVLPQILILGLLGMVICGGGVYLSLRHTTASNSTLIYTSSAILVVLMEAYFFRERLSPMRLVGALIGFAGVAAIILRGEPERLLSFSFNVGDLGIAFAAVAWAGYSLILKRKELAGLPSLPLFAAIAVGGTAVLAPFMLYELANTGALPRGQEQWLAILALAIFPSVLAFGLYQLGIKYAGPSITGMSLYLLPVYGVGLAAVLLGEEIHGYHIAGLLLVLFGVVLATEPFKRKPAPQA